MSNWFERAAFYGLLWGQRERDERRRRDPDGGDGNGRFIIFVIVLFVILSVLTGA